MSPEHERDGSHVVVDPVGAFVLTALFLERGSYAQMWLLFEYVDGFLGSRLLRLLLWLDLSDVLPRLPIRSHDAPYTPRNTLRQPVHLRGRDRSLKCRVYRSK